jgi:nucleoside transporter
MAETIAENQATSTDLPAATPLPMKLRLYGMMFLQYFVQGCYLPIMTLYVKDALGFDGTLMGQFAAALSLGPLAAPFVIGQVVDRHIASQWVLSFCHLAAGVTMLAMYWLMLGGFELDRNALVWSIMGLGTLYSVLYVPTMMLTNSLAFSHLRNRDREFPVVRLFGTLGFVLPAWVIELYWLRGLTGEELNQARGVAFWLSGAVGIVMAVYSLTLPYTPPQRRGGKFAPAVVVGMLKHRNFLVLVLVTFFIAMVHNYHFLWNSPFLKAALRNAGIEGAYEQRISSIGQISEVLVMALLGLAIVRLGFKRVMLIGAAAYMLRCLTFAVAAASPPTAQLALACLGQTLHGLCFGCFLAAAYIYVDRVAPPDVRGSMQNVFGTFVIGLGAVMAGVLGGQVGELFSTTTGDVTVYSWTNIWLAGAALATACLAVFAIWFPADESTVEH